MRAMKRRIVGIGGAAIVAVGATLALAGVASAHGMDANLTCDQDTHVATVTIHNTRPYKPEVGKSDPNTVTITIDNGTPQVTNFNINFDHNLFPDVTPFTLDATKVHTVDIAVVAWDAPKDPVLSPTFHLTNEACLPKPSPSTTTPPPSSTSSNPVVPPTTTTTTTTAVAVASKQLPNTGVSADLPLGIGAALVVVGAGVLFYIRMSARRRHSS